MVKKWVQAKMITAVGDQVLIGGSYRILFISLKDGQKRMQGPAKIAENLMIVITPRQKKNAAATND